MTYRGYTTKRTTQAILNIGSRPVLGIFLGDKLMAPVQDDSALIKRVIDQKIKEGVWPSETEGATA